jgi:small-conductance mechanosensitive channel
MIGGTAHCFFLKRLCLFAHPEVADMSIQEMLPQIPAPYRPALLALVTVGLLFLVFHAVLRRWFKRLRQTFQGIRVPTDLLFSPFRFLFPPVCFLIATYLLVLPQKIKILFNHVFVVWFIIGLAWLIIRLTAMLKSMILTRYKTDVKDNLKARQISTQIGVIQRVIIVIVFILAVSAILMTFEKVRQVGLSIMASAGIAGIIIGFAAQRSLATLIAGIQIAITQPIRIDDVVIVENEWGWIEEITLTYVVIRIWDQRRLVVPITYFIERPFQNWTRTTAELLGTVYLYADYGLPVDELRKELFALVRQTGLWDQRVAQMQVTQATEKSMEIRILVSAEDSSKAWDLRCLIREKMIDYIRRNHPEYLPRLRVETEASQVKETQQA